MHCFWHTYTEGCANRNPKRLIPSYLNTRFEIQDAARRYSSIFVMSEYMRRESILAGIPEEQLVLNPYFTTIPEMRTRRYSSAPRRLLFVGRLIEHKGVDLMLESLAPLLKTQPHLELHLCGSGLHEDRYRRFVADNHLSDQIIFHGWVSHKDIPTHLEQADILIFPSVYPEAFGIVGIEAMARGIPVVGFDVGGVSTWLSHEESGLLIPQPDPVALREGVIHLLADNPSYQKISEQGREIARQKFSPEVHLNRLIQAYQSSASASLPPH